MAAPNPLARQRSDAPTRTELHGIPGGWPVRVYRTGPDPLHRSAIGTSVAVMVGRVGRLRERAKTTMTCRSPGDRRTAWSVKVPCEPGRGPGGVFRLRPGHPSGWHGRSS